MTTALPRHEERPGHAAMWRARLAADGWLAVQQLVQSTGLNQGNVYRSVRIWARRGLFERQHGQRHGAPALVRLTAPGREQIAAWVCADEWLAS